MMIETAWIIDDDDIYRYGFGKFVAHKSLCKNLFDFNSSTDAVNRIIKNIELSALPDVIFMSADMKDESCWEFMAAFETLKTQLNFKKIAIYLLTSSINYQDIEDSQNYSEISDYIIKPIDSQQFINAFENFR